MMVFGHQASAADGPYFVQNHSYLSPARSLPDENAPQQQQPPPLHHHQQSPPPPPPQQQQQAQQLLLPPPPKLQFQGVSSDSVDEGCCDGTCEGGGDDGGSSGFLYNLLTAQDAAAVQQCSAFLGGTADQFPRRSNSVSVPARRGSAALPATSQPFAAALGLGGHLLATRPSSVPRGLRGPYGGGSAPALTTEEPLDLSSSTMRPTGEFLLEQHQLLLQQQQQQQQQEMQLQQHMQCQLQQLQQLHHQQQQQLHLQQQPMLHNMLRFAEPGSTYPMSQQLQQQQQQQLQHVQLAKKTVPVVQSHVADWLKKGTDLVRTNGALFGALDKTDRADLLCRAWPRILQLYMLEHSFQFTVSSVNDSDAVAAFRGGDDAGRRATREFAEELQRMVSSAAVLPLDNMTYNLLRLAAIFLADSPQESHLAEVQDELLRHILRHLSIKGMSQHFKDAVALLEAVARTDKSMLENLFCNHLLNMSVDDFIRSQLGY